MRVLHTLRLGEYNGVFFGGMGEPLLHSRIFEMIATAHTAGKRTELITNATMLTAETSQKLVESGLDCLWVSVDGFSKESYEQVRLGGLYDAIVQNLRSFREIGKDVEMGIAFVMMKENLQELDRGNIFLDSLGIDFLHLSHVLPGNALSEKDSVYDLPYAVGKVKRFEKEKIFEKELDVCPFVREGTTFIRYDGEVVPCMQLLHNSYTYLYEEQRKVYRYAYGNIRTQDLKEIYNSPAYQAFRVRVENFEFPCCTLCMGCEDRKENLTDCAYNQAPTCGACLWAQGLIRCP